MTSPGHTLGQRVLRVLLAAGLAMVGCQRNGSIADEIERRAVSGEEFALADVTPFEWDRCAVLAPYTSRGRAEQLLQVRWPTFPALGLESNDSFHLLACSRAGEITGTARLPRSIGFTADTTGRVLLRGATLRPVGDGSGVVLEAPLRVDLPELSPNGAR